MGNSNSKGGKGSYKKSKSTKMVPSLNLLDDDFVDKSSPHGDGQNQVSRYGTTDIINFLECTDDHEKHISEMDTSNIIVELWANRQQDKNFMKLASKYEFPEILKLQVKMLGSLIDYDEVKHFNRMMRTAFTQPISYLHLGGGHYGDLSSFNKSFKNILPLVTEQIFLVSFKIDGDTLHKIFKYATNVKSLVLCDCKIDFTSFFAMDPTIEYNMETLDLYGTCDKKDHSKLDVKKTTKFVGELAKSQLLYTLKHIHANGIDFSAHDLQYIFNEQGFSVKVKSDGHNPSNITV